MAERELILMVGLPKSGKTTKAMELGHPVVNPGSIRLALYGQRFINQMEPIVWHIVRTMIHSLFISGHTKVILDSTNITRYQRNSWRSRNWSTSYVELNTPIEECIARAKGAPELIPIIVEMAKEFESVTDEEKMPDM